MLCPAGRCTRAPMHCPDAATALPCSMHCTALQVKLLPCPVLQVKPMPKDMAGLVMNTAQDSKVEQIVFRKNGNKSSQVTGTLLGKTPYSIAGISMHMAFHFYVKHRKDGSVTRSGGVSSANVGRGECPPPP